MIMTSSAVLTSSSSGGGGGGYKLDSAGKVDLGKSQGAAGGDTFIGLRREPGSEYVISVPSNVLGNIHNSSGGSPQLHQGKAKLVPATVGLVVGSGQEENWGGFGTQQAQQKTYTLGKPMGGESSPAKNKTLLGQSQTKTNNMGKADPPAVLNPVRPQPPREDAVGGGGVTAAAVVGQGSEHSQEGKRGNLRKGPGHSQTQSNCIRQILLLQLELIEQQQQQLQAKSKEIDDLKVEKEMLVARIERMERRLQLGKKEGGGEQQQRGGSRREDQGPGTPEGQGSAEGRGATTPRTLHFGRGGKGHKRRFLFQDPRSVKSRRNQPKVSPPKEGLLFSKEEPESGSDVEDASPDASCAHTEDLDYLSTTDMYLCCWHLPPPSPPPSPWREPSPKKNDCVAIPSWRENNMDPLGKEETTDVPENLDDNVFLKRHSKHELDEKRRKRWDIQRIREQRMFQRLQQRMNRRKGIQETEPEVLSFYPEPEDVESLIITPHLPVVAFGRPLPKLTRRSFDLPWLDDRSRCRVEMPKKQTPHRTCRK